MARFVAIPDVTLGLSSDSIDETVLAAFMLLVLLTAAQAGLTIYSVFHGYRQTSSIWTTIQASHRCQTLASMGLCLLQCIHPGILISYTAGQMPAQKVRYC